MLLPGRGVAGQYPARSDLGQRLLPQGACEDVLPFPVADPPDDNGYEAVVLETQRVASRRTPRGREVAGNRIVQDERPLGAPELARARLRDARERVGSKEASSQHRPEESGCLASSLLVDLAHADDVGCAGTVGDRLAAEDERCVG